MVERESLVMFVDVDSVENRLSSWLTRRDSQVATDVVVDADHREILGVNECVGETGNDVAEELSKNVNIVGMVGNKSRPRIERQSGERKYEGLD